MKTREYTREELLDVLASYLRLIRRNGRSYPAPTLDDLEKSLLYVLHKNGRTPGTGWRAATPFTDDPEKMRDFRELTRDEFLQSYSYLTEEEYDATATAIAAR